MIDILDYNTLQCRLKAAKAKLEEFRSGAAYAHVLELREEDQRYYHRIIGQLENELADAHAKTVSVRNQWFEVFEDVQKEHDKEISGLESKLRAMEERALKAERERDEARDEVKAIRHELYETASRLEEEQGKNLKLRAQLNRDYENSSIPSSRSRKQKTISNNREKTGRKPGGQPGHEGHGRKKQTPANTIFLPPPKEVEEDPGFRKTGKEIVKQLVSVYIGLDVTEYHADIYYNSQTGERIHAPFPEGVVNDVNYDGSVRAFLYLLNNECNVSIDKCSAFLRELTGGALSISKGMISSLSRSFAEKADIENRHTCSDMLLAPVMHIDCTNAKVNGKQAQIFICTTPNGEALYFARKKKGHEGVKGTVAEDYQGILVHDHESTFYNYGSGHQECLAHVLRYLKNSIENEPEREWNKKMHPLIREMIHYRKTIPEGSGPDPDRVADYERRYREILEAAKQEYEDVPVSDYYREGYNLYLRMDKLMENHLLFLHDMRVPMTNNAAERGLRPIKRKQAQAMTFRSFNSIDYLCRGMSRLNQIRQTGENLFDRVSEIFG